MEAVDTHAVQARHAVAVQAKSGADDRVQTANQQGANQHMALAGRDGHCGLAWR